MPGPVGRGRLVVVCAIASLVAGCGSARDLSVSPQRSTGSSPCRMPSVPSTPTGNGQLELSGPALSVLTGGAATGSLALDNGGFKLTPPPPGAKPAVSQSAIVCEALASSELDGLQFGDELHAGMAVGYGLVSVSPSVRFDNSTFDETGMPKAPALPPTYDQRLAWAVVVFHQETASCPAMTVPTASTSSTTNPAAATWNYSIFLADAATGTDALAYTEAAPALCGGPGAFGPYQSIPIETISVPWTLLSRDPNGYSGQIDAQIPVCWTPPNAVGVQRGSNVVEVEATSIAGQSCGPPRPVKLTLQADTVFDDLPAHLAAAPLGPAIQSASLPAATPAPAKTGQLITLTTQQNGTTLTIHVGDVLVGQPPLVPLPPQHPAAGDAIRSSNDAVISQLPANGVAIPEFRAWQTGRATLSNSTGWSVTVVVTDS